MKFSFAPHLKMNFESEKDAKRMLPPAFQSTGRILAHENFMVQFELDKTVWQLNIYSDATLLTYLKGIATWSDWLLIWKDLRLHLETLWAQKLQFKLAGTTWKSTRMVFDSDKKRISLFESSELNKLLPEPEKGDRIGEIFYDSLELFVGNVAWAFNYPGYNKYEISFSGSEDILDWEDIQCALDGIVRQIHSHWGDNVTCQILGVEEKLETCLTAEEVAYLLLNRNSDKVFGDLSVELELENENPLLILDGILCAMKQDLTPQEFGQLAAGPLENLLSTNDPELIDRVEAEARQNPLFNELLGGVWKLGMSDETWERINAVRNRVW